MIENKKNQVAIAVGSRVRNIRQSKGLTIEQLAFEIGVEYTQLSRIERGRINTSVYQLFLISKALGISFSEIINGLDKIQYDLLEY
jgi:transcriptional regulator with XRE-family HTH domain